MRKVFGVIQSSDIPDTGKFGHFAVTLAGKDGRRPVWQI